MLEHSIIFGYTMMHADRFYSEQAVDRWLTSSHSTPDAELLKFSQDQKSKAKELFRLLVEADNESDFAKWAELLKTMYQFHMF